MRALHSLVNQVKIQKSHGCLILDVIYRASCSGVAEVRETMQSILHEGHKVFYKQLLAWILKGSLHDPLSTAITLDTLLRVLQILAVIFETLNFITMLSIAVSISKDFESVISAIIIEGGTDLATFRRWLTIEALMFIVTVLSNIIIIFLRTFAKDPLQLDFDSITNPEVETLDYLRSESTQNLVNLMSICLFPLGVYGFVLSNYKAEMSLSDDESKVLQF